MRKLTDINQYTGIIERYRQKETLTNDYLQQTAPDLIIHERLYALCNDRNAFLFVKKDIGMRMYYYINDLDEKADFSSSQDLVTEILFRGELPKAEMEYLAKCGFIPNLIRDSYAGTYKDLSKNFALVPGIVVEKAQTLLAVKTACELFNDSFDRLSGDFISESEYRSLLDSGSILIAWNADKSSFLGALHQKKEGAVNVIGHVAVMQHARGHGVGKALLDAFIEWNKSTVNLEKTRYGLWVQRRNEVAVNMYRKSGFRYINKSTVSLIKYNQQNMEKLLAILKEIRPDVDFENEEALIEDGILDSFDVVSIISEIDDRFGVQIRITELDPDNFNSVQAIWNLIQDLRS